MSGTGIVSYGIYVPRYRMSRKTIAEAMGWLSPGVSPGEKAVANHDEDSLTMAAAAGLNSLNSVDRTNVDGLYFATTTPAYRERESAAIIANALDLRADVRTADFTDSLKSGTGALLSACDSVSSKTVKKMLVCASDCRLGKPGSAQEAAFGDAAAAFLLGRDRVIATLEGSYSLSYDFPDYRRAEADKFVRATEERFIREEGYTKFVAEAISGLFKKYKLEAKDFAKVAYPCPFPREHAATGKKLGFQAGQMQQPLLNVIGETGAASPLILLATMLEESRPGDRILLVSYGNGAEALSFKVTDEIENARAKNRVSKYFNSKKALASYAQYLAFKGILPVETGAAEETAGTRLALTWRERKAILALYGSKCKKCGTPQYPPQRICVNPDCRATDEMEDYRFSDKKGAIFSYTEDHVAPSVNPPMIFGMVDFEGGGRFVFEFTDCESGALKTGQPVELTLRRKYIDELRGIIGYFWKAMPAR